MPLLPRQSDLLLKWSRAAIGSTWRHQRRWRCRISGRPTGPMPVGCESRPRCRDLYRPPAEILCGPRRAPSRIEDSSFRPSWSDRNVADCADSRWGNSVTRALCRRHLCPIPSSYTTQKILVNRNRSVPEWCDTFLHEGSGQAQDAYRRTRPNRARADDFPPRFAERTGRIASWSSLSRTALLPGAIGLGTTRAGRAWLGVGLACGRKAR